MLLSPVLSLLVDTGRSSTSGLKVMGESDTPSIRLGTDAPSIRLGEEALPKTLERTIARLFIVVGLVAGGMPVA